MNLTPLSFNLSASIISDFQAKRNNVLVEILRKEKPLRFRANKRNGFYFHILAARRSLFSSGRSGEPSICRHQASIRSLRFSQVNRR